MSSAEYSTPGSITRTGRQVRVPVKYQSTTALRRVKKSKSLGEKKVQAKLKAKSAKSRYEDISDDESEYRSGRDTTRTGAGLGKGRGGSPRPGPSAAGATAQPVQPLDLTSESEGFLTPDEEAVNSVLPDSARVVDLPHLETIGLDPNLPEIEHYLGLVNNNNPGPLPVIDVSDLEFGDLEDVLSYHTL